jgi:hypothetical protein
MSLSFVAKQAWYGLWLAGKRLRTPRKAAERKTNELIFQLAPLTNDSGDRKIGPIGRDLDFGGPVIDDPAIGTVKDER